MADTATTSGGAPEFLFAFESIDASLEFVPLAARRALDLAGTKLSLVGWRSLTLEDRAALARAGFAARVELAVVHAILSRATPAPAAIDRRDDPPAREAPGEVRDALGAEHAIDAARWGALRAIDRYALAKLAHEPEKLRAAYEEIVGPRSLLTHLTEAGEAHMVDVSRKAPTVRSARATARVAMSADALERIVAGAAAKGDVLAVARVAAIQAAKRTPELIPLCHQVALTRVEIDFRADVEKGSLLVSATAEALDRTGVEMEAMVAASVAALTIYDMVKGVDRWMRVERVQLEEKRGGRSGDVRRAVEESER